jgi:hypothetical protein
MRLVRFVTPIAALTAGVTGLVALPALSGSASATTKSSAPSCQSITRAQVIAAGFSGASAPTVTAFNDKKLTANPPNSLGETIDFGSKALAVGCATPTDLKALSVAANGASKPALTAPQYLQYLAKNSAGAMKRESRTPDVRRHRRRSPRSARRLVGIVDAGSFEYWRDDATL